MRRLLLAAAVAALACQPPRAEPPRGVLTLTASQSQATWIRNFNPLMPGSRWPSAAGIYEPLAIYNSVAGAWVPWLATSWAWRDEGLTLAFTPRAGVSWSDGAPFSADDVVFTFELLRRFPALDQKSVWSFLEAVQRDDSGEVTFRFKRPYVPALAWIAHQPIVPKHAWAGVEDPVAFTNPTPIATGPFTEVRLFQNQVYELGKNPRYWQPGKPGIEAIRLPAFPGNDQANLALVDGELDWAANYVPAIERVYVRKDPTHHHYWFPALGSTVFLYANTTRAPFGDVRVRKALSLAIDRSLIVDVAMSRYTNASDATALSAAYDAWRDQAAVTKGAAWMRFDAVEAGRLLDEAGLTRNEKGQRVLPDGKPLTASIAVVNGWSDWVRAAQVISRGFKKLGVDAPVRLFDEGTWFQRLQRGEFDLAVGWSIEGVAPYEFYRWLMSPQTVQPMGSPAPGNWHRYGSEAAAPLFAELERTTDAAREKELEAALQHVFVDEAPAIPLFPNPSWGEFNTRRFEGFPDAKNPWAALSPNKMPDALLVLTAVKTRAEAP
ncbi:MAG: ABC transporter substrate-binding protein [Myxococcaceae bacterium]|nr:ABC transporter substrate-binding protein [Myxococcaceae bacterium]